MSDLLKSAEELMRAAEEADKRGENDTALKHAASAMQAVRQQERETDTVRNKLVELQRGLWQKSHVDRLRMTRGYRHGMAGDSPCEATEPYLDGYLRGRRERAQTQSR